MKPEFTAVILAGGLGTRLKMEVSDRPKVLAPLGGRPFLGRLLEQARGAGAVRAVLCTGYMAEQVEAAVGAEYQGLPVIYSRETEPLGTGGALRQALAQCAGDAVLVMNGDSYCGADLQAFWAWHRKGRRAAMILVEAPDTERFGRVAADGDGRIEAFLEKGQSGPGWINAGVYLLPRELIEALPAGRQSSLERDHFPTWAAAGRLWGWRAAGCRFFDIGTPESYRAAQVLAEGPGGSEKSSSVAAVGPNHQKA